MIKIIVVGKLKEKYLIDLVNDYSKRISKYHKLKIIELKDSNIKDEKQEILKHIDKRDYIISTYIKGELLTTLEFTNLINNNLISGNSKITFIIGGSDGLDKEILNMSNKLISFSRLTFPHGLFRGILLEQIYCSFKIMNNETYHK